MTSAARRAVLFLVSQGLAASVLAAGGPNASVIVRLSTPLTDPLSANLEWLNPEKELPVDRTAWKIVGTEPATRIELGLDCAVLPKTLRIVSPTQASVPLVLESALCAGSRPATVDVELLPVAWAAGRCRLPGPGTGPASRTAALRVRRCSQRESKAEMAFLLPVRLNSGGEWKAKVAAGCVDLSYEEKGFVRETWYGLEFPQQQTTQLDDRNLRASASLSGAATTPDGAPAGPDSYAFLLSPKWVPSSFGELLSGRFPSRRLADQKLGPKGEFGFSDLPPGTYTLIVAAGRSDLAVHLSEGVEVRAGQALRLPAVALQFGATVDVIVDPEGATSTTGSELLVSLVPPGRYLKDSPPVGEVEMVPGVPARFSGLAPGDWQIELFEQSSGGESSGGESSGWMNRLDSKRSMLHSGDQITVEFRMEGEVFTGVVDSQDEHLEELFLSFHSAGGTDSRTPPQARLSKNGEFSVRLPRPGLYSIQVDAPSDPGRNVLVDDVLFESAKKRVTIQLSSSSIVGLVVDADNQPVAGAFVDAARSASSVEGGGRVRPQAFKSAKSGQGGRFELRGLGPGEWRLAAHRDRERSNESRVELAPDASLDVRLALRENRTVRGRLVQPGGAPLAGVHGYLIDASESSLSFDRFSTDNDGAFEVDRPVGAGGVTLVRMIVVSPDRFAAAAPWNPEASDTIEIPFPSGRLTLPTTFAGRTLNSANLVLRNDAGGVVPLSLLSALEGWSGGGTVVSSIGLALGAWSILEVDESMELEPFLRGQIPGREVARVLATEAGVHFID